MEEHQALDAFAALSHEIRLRIVRFLVEQGPGGAAAGDIGAATGVTASRLSFHLASLERAGLVSSERVSRNILYRADYERLGQLIGFLMSDCCGNHPDVRACC